MNKINKETFTRSDIELILKKEFPNISKSNISEAINIILESITEAVALDEKVEIRGFGTFCLHTHQSRIVVNPKTKKISYLGETATMHFKPSKSLVKK